MKYVLGTRLGLNELFDLIAYFFFLAEFPYVNVFKKTKQISEEEWPLN